MGKDLTKLTNTFLFCDGGACQKAGSEAAIREARAYLRNTGKHETTHTIKTRCNGRCEDAPTWIVEDGNNWYKNVTPEKAVAIVKSHLEEGKPKEEYLLYKPGFAKLKSDNERTPFKIKPFEFKEDAELGNCWITRGFSSDQYLYPLFLYLHENCKNVSLKIPSKEAILFADITAVNYTSDFALELITQKEKIELVIAAVPKAKPELVPLKISVTEYYFQQETEEVGIRFKNKKGETLGVVLLGEINDEAWKYCTKVQLQNLALNFEIV